MRQEKPTFIDLFAGIGGFHIALHNLGATCVFASEWNQHSRKTYAANFKLISPHLFEPEKTKPQGLFAGDITKVDKKLIPNFDILTGGFPCQPFSQAGHRRGFNDTRGTLFYDIAEILKIKRPKAYFIENVRGLLRHDDGNTIAVMKATLNKLGYSFHLEVIKASDFGLPTHRPRLFMVGFRDDVGESVPFNFPEPFALKVTLSDLLGGQWNKDIGYTLRVGGAGSGINDRRNWDTYIINGTTRRITVKEGAKIMGFPDDFIFPVSDAQAMKQLGNSVAIAAIQATAKNVIESLQHVKG